MNAAAVDQIITSNQWLEAMVHRVERAGAVMFDGVEVDFRRRVGGDRLRGRRRSGERHRIAVLDT